MAFRFRLERVLRLREQLRRQAVDALGEARAVVARIDDAIAAARAAQAATRAAEAAEHEFSGADLRRWRTFAEAARAREERLAAERAVAEAVVAERREGVLARRRDERALEHLRERARARREAHDEAAAAKLLDELALRGRQERGR